jgi:hypothetical protein
MARSKANTSYYASLGDVNLARGASKADLAVPADVAQGLVDPA